MDMDIRNLDMRDPDDNDSLDSQDMELDKLLMGDISMEVNQGTQKDVRPDSG